MTRKINLHKKVEKYLPKIPVKDGKRISHKIQQLSANPYPRGCIKLTTKNQFRVRVGNYRILYTVHPARVDIEDIDDRKNIYR